MLDLAPHNANTDKLEYTLGFDRIRIRPFDADNLRCPRGL